MPCFRLEPSLLQLVVQHDSLRLQPGLEAEPGGQPVIKQRAVQIEDHCGDRRHVLDATTVSNSRSGCWSLAPQEQLTRLR